MQAGHPFNADFNGAEQEGVGRYDYTIRARPALERGARLSGPGARTART